MIYQYTTIYTNRCEKCTYLTGGPKAELPVIRRLTKSVKLVKKTATTISTTSATTEAHTVTDTNNSTDATRVEKDDDNVKTNIKDDKAPKIEGKNVPDGDVVMKDEADEKDEKATKKEDSKPDDAQSGDEEEEVEVVEERWIAYHESCLE